MLPINKGSMLKSLLYIILMLAVVAGCSNEDTPRKIRLERTEPSQIIERHPSERPVRIAVGGMITPREGR